MIKDIKSMFVVDSSVKPLLLRKALDRTRHAHPFFDGLEKRDDGLKIPKMTGSMPAKLKSV